MKRSEITDLSLKGTRAAIVNWWPDRTRVGVRGALSPVSDAAQHLLPHHEADRLDRLDKEPSPSPLVRISLTYEQSRRLVRIVSERERPGEIV
jgi:hypothetical protein